MPSKRKRNDRPLIPIRSRLQHVAVELNRMQLVVNRMIVEIDKLEREMAEPVLVSMNGVVNFVEGK